MLTNVRGLITYEAFAWPVSLIVAFACPLLSLIALSLKTGLTYLTWCGFRNQYAVKCEMHSTLYEWLIVPEIIVRKN